ncbi:hypothetical protein [Nocardia sp. NPDC056000]|uniref:hypothetical protein n=1 Tax=Nocardia sp. NPDC056000 TaxID=3345674 RepID=UPI0035D7B313
MQKTTVRRGAIAGGIAGVAVLAALLAPAVANAAAPDATGGEVARPGVAIPVDPNVQYPSDPSETVLVTKDEDGNVTVQRGRPGQLPPGAIPATPLEPGQHGVTILPRDTYPASPVVPALPAPSTGSAG